MTVLHFFPPGATEEEEENRICVIRKGGLNMFPPSLIVLSSTVMRKAMSLTQTHAFKLLSWADVSDWEIPDLLLSARYQCRIILVFIVINVFVFHELWVWMTPQIKPLVFARLEDQTFDSVMIDMQKNPTDLLYSHIYRLERCEEFCMHIRTISMNVVQIWKAAIKDSDE